MATKIRKSSIWIRLDFWKLDCRVPGPCCWTLWFLKRVPWRRVLRTTWGSLECWDLFPGGEGFAPLVPERKGFAPFAASMRSMDGCEALSSRVGDLQVACAYNEPNHKSKFNLMRCELTTSIKCCHPHSTQIKTNNTNQEAYTSCFGDIKCMSSHVECNETNPRSSFKSCLHGFSIPWIC